MNDVKRLADYTAVTVEQQVQFRNAALEVEKEYQALRAENDQLKQQVACESFDINKLAGDTINKLKAGAVMEAMDNLLMNGGYGMSFSDAVAALEEYANKLEAGE